MKILENLPLSQDDICQNCLSIGMIIFHEIRSVPANSCIMLSTRREALEYPKGDILLGFCPHCGFISNVAFDPKLTEYSDRYEETQGFSPTFQKFHRELAIKLIERYHLHKKTIIEIGCGKGEFLSLLCELGGNQGIGFDPAYINERNESKAVDRITFIKDYYSEKDSFYQGDLLVCKMTLEHIPNTKDFLTMIRRSIGNKLDTIIFFQVPDVTRILKDTGFEDIYYEHCSYFSPESIASVFQSCRFDILHLSTTFNNQYLTLEARPAGEDIPLASYRKDLNQLKGYINNFQTHFQNKLAFWQGKLNDIRADGKRAVLWGSGSKAVSFLTTLKVFDEIQYVVDINPYRQGFYVAGSGQKIVSPSFLKHYEPDTVIIMNPIYETEIQGEIRNMELTLELITV
jgi:Methyltransferase domain/C-methyltransferase C-terminal domain